MRRLFRLGPSELRRGLLLRTRLLSVLLERWGNRVTLLVAGPGFGKTTLLLQAMAENNLAPRGEDVWIGIEPQDVEGETLASAVAAALATTGAPSSLGGGGGADNTRDLRRFRHATVADVANAAWRRAPTEICLIFDDVHLLPAGSAGARWLGALIDELPANAHVVLAGRAEPPMPLARLGVQGAVRRVDEDHLRFSPAELDRFAGQRGIDPEQLASTGGWPAVAELAASVDRRLSGAFLWEEVLEPLGPDRRHVLGVLTDLGGADDELASAAVGRPVVLADELDGVPLVTEVADGWYVPHSLWHSAPGVALAPDDRAEVHRRAAAHLQSEGQDDEAFTLVERAGLWDDAPTLLRATCLAMERLTTSRLDRWLAASPASVRASSAGQLAAALHTSFVTPADAAEPLWAAAQRLRDEGDVDAELTALAVLGRLAWTGQPLRGKGAEVAGRLTELGSGPDGHPQARGIAALFQAMIADFRGDDDGALAALENIEPHTLDPAWDAIARWITGLVRLDLGDAEAAREIMAQVTPTDDPAVRAILGGLQLRIWWALGRVDRVVDDVSTVLDHVRTAGGADIVYQGMHAASTVYSHVGDVRAARRCLDEAGPTPAGSTRRLSAGPALVMASLQLAEGDEERAAESLRSALQLHDDAMDRGVDRHMWRHLLPLSYVLLPEARAHWDRLAQRGYLATSREQAAAVVALREGRGDRQLRDLDLSDLERVRAGLHHRFAAELAVGLAALGRPEGAALLEALGPVGRDAVRALAAGDGGSTRAAPSARTARTARSARALLGAVPAPPRQVAELSVLGPMTLRLRGDAAPGVDVVEPDLGRKRLRALLAYLVIHRKTDRATIMGALWPDLGERAASNNLAVTLTYVLAALEPTRAAGEPAYLVRVEGRSVWLVTGPHLQVDVDRFEHHLTEAAQAEAAGTPSVALDHDLAAAELYRGELFADVPDADWMVLDREHYRTRFVTAAVRAGQLLLGRGDSDEAEAMARRALTADPWAEEAYAVLVAAAVANGDRSGARRLLDRCIAALADIGVAPSDATRQLQRRVQGTIALASGS
jgi:ATP/maltotriose-dependent transcriptional regulator MalT/DNA-binding SARP family transcriptional activator